MSWDKERVTVTTRGVMTSPTRVSEDRLKHRSINTGEYSTQVWGSLVTLLALET